MRREQLHNLGLSPEQINFVLAENGKDIQREQRKVGKGADGGGFDEAGASDAEVSEGKQDSGVSDEMKDSCIVDGESGSTDFESETKDVGESTDSEVDGLRAELAEKDEIIMSARTELADYKRKVAVKEALGKEMFTSEFAKTAILDELLRMELEFDGERVSGLDDAIATLKKKDGGAFCGKLGANRLVLPPTGSMADRGDLITSKVREIMGIK